MTDTGPLRDYSRSRAVLIGAWDYAHLTPVPPARNSLDRMVGLLTGPLCGWPKQRVEVLRNVRQRDRLPDQLMGLFDSVVDVALFYFVGHGQLHEDDLCLALRESPEAGPRRTTVGLPFSDVRAALRACDAQTKIVILDCCFAGQAARPEHSLAAMSTNMIDKTLGTGAVTMAASGPYRTAGFEPDPDLARPQTYFTKYLVDVIEQGIPGYPQGLPLGLIYARTADTLARDRRPEPTRSVRHDADRFILARNVAKPAESPTALPGTPMALSADSVGRPLREYDHALAKTDEHSDAQQEPMSQIPAGIGVSEPLSGQGQGTLPDAAVHTGQSNTALPDSRRGGVSFKKRPRQAPLRTLTRKALSLPAAFQRAAVFERTEVTNGAGTTISVATTTVPGTAAATRPPSRRTVLTAAAAFASITVLAALLVTQPWLDGRSANPDGASGRAHSSATSSLDTLLPVGAPAYSATQGGGASYANAYADGPSRRPKNWKPWRAPQGTGECVYAEASLICTGEAGTVRLDAATGAKRWTNTGASLYGQNVPAVSGDKVFVNDGEAVHALQLSDGKEQWAYRTTILTQHLTVDGVNAYVTEHGGRLHAVDLSSGKARWTFHPSVRNTSGYPPSVRSMNGSVYLFSGSDNNAPETENLVSVLDARSGQRTAEYQLNPGCDMGTAALAWESGGPILYCVATDSTGQREGVRRYDLKARKDSVTSVGGIQGGQVGAQKIAVAGGRVYLVTSDNERRPALTAIDPAQQKVVWHTDLPVIPPGGFDSPPVAAGGQVYVAGAGTIAAFDPSTGKLLWHHEETGALNTPSPNSELFDTGPDHEPLIVGGVVFAPTTGLQWFSAENSKG